jgi:hypothetical protein
MDMNSTLWIVLDYFFLGSLNVYSPFAVMVSLWNCRENGVFHIFVEVSDYFLFYLSAILNRQGESRAVLPTLQDRFQILEQRLRHC